MKNPSPIPFTREQLRRLLDNVNAKGALSAFQAARIEATIDEGFQGEQQESNNLAPNPMADELADKVILEGAKAGIYRLRMDEGGNFYFIDSDTWERVY